MNEEEEFDDDEEYVPRKSKISLKSVLKALGTMAVVVTGLYLINLNTGDTTSWAAGFMMLCVGSTLINYRAPSKKKIKQVYSIYKCSVASCGIKELHEFKEGDYVYKTIGPCFKCSGSLYIDQIFAVLTKAEGQIKMARANSGASTSVEET
nr:hypothetical protein [Candidatus Sigynarchaeota archaeon]